MSDEKNAVEIARLDERMAGIDRNLTAEIKGIREQHKAQYEITEERQNKLEVKMEENHTTLVEIMDNMNKWMNWQKGLYAGVGTFLGSAIAYFVRGN